MKNLKRFIVLSIVFVGSFFIINKSVLAKESRVSFNFSSGSPRVYNGFKFNDYYGSFGSISSSNRANQFRLSCLDPGLPIANLPGGPRWSTYNLTEVTFDKNTVDQAQLYGLAMIIKNGTDSPYETNSSVSGATDMAIRAYSLYVLSEGIITYNESTVKNSPEQASLRKLGYEVAQSYSSDLQNYGIVTNVNKGKSEKYSYYSASRYSAAANLLRIAYQAAINYRKSSFGSEVKVSITTSDYVDKDNPHGLDIQEKLVTFKIKQTNANNPGFVKISPSDIVCNNCAKYGITMPSIQYLENDSWKPLQGEIDLAKIVDPRTGYARVKITLHKQQIEEIDCAATITLKYRVPSLVDNSVKVYIANHTKGVQRYAGGKVVNRNSTTVMDSEKSYTIPANAIGCLSNVKCETKISTPYCDAEDVKNVAQVEAPTNIKKCIIGQKDDAGNEYKVYQDSVNNEYCATYCKEDYKAIKLNKALEGLKCGSYFKLKAHIEGSQDCYRAGEGTTSINKEQFMIDVLDAQLDLVDAWNNYAKLKASQSNIGTGNTVDGSYTGKEVININESTATFGLRDATYTYHYEAASNEALKEQINKDLEAATKELNPEAEGAYKNFKDVIAKYNSCVTDWDKKFAFAQKVGWEYTELTDGGYPNLNENSTLNNLIDEDDRVLDPVGEKITSKNVQACTGEVNNEYTTCDGSVNNWKKPEDTFTNNTYVICDTNGCRNVYEKVSNAKYVKQHSEASQDYESKEQFYQVVGSGPASGAITSAKDFNVPGIQTTPIPGIPLSLDSIVGGTFRLTIRDLGEFYDRTNKDEKYGRLLDMGGEQANQSIGGMTGRTTPVWNGEYTCYYKNDCLPCPDCDFECELPDGGGECVWRECPECSVECVNCIFNLGQLQLSNKTISTNNFGSADREYGYNWNINTSLASLELIRDKASATIEEIEETNTTIYDEGNEEALEFEIKMTPEVTQYIRKYNAKAEGSDNNQSEGGYGNDSLTCYKYEDENGVIHENLFCYSDFIDELVDQGFEIKANHRSSASDRVDSEGNLKDLSYWTPWVDDKQYADNVIGGPAWK